VTARRAVTAAAVLAVVALAVAGLLRATGVTGQPSLQDRVDAVAATLKCPTCAGLSIEDSTAALATGSKQIIRQQLQQGRSPDQVRAWFVDRYGEQVLLSPDPGGPGLLVWLLPAAAVLAGGVGAWRWTRRRRPAGDADGAAAALADHRAGRLVPDDSPAGDALQAALGARLAAEEDGDAELVARADVRLAAAARRYAARSVSAAPARAARPRRGVPRRAVLVGTVAVVAGGAGLGLGLAAHGRGTGAPLTGDAVPAAASASAASSAAPVAAPPAGWTGGMPRSAGDWVALGQAYDKQQQYVQALAAYDMALKLQPGADDVVLLRDDVLVRSGKPADALPTLRQLGQRYPGNPDVLLILGLAQNRTGDPAAAGTLEQFLRLAPDSPAAPGIRKLLGQQ
jgi:cytochrome c-type biogenesis protein CcmH